MIVSAPNNSSYMASIMHESEGALNAVTLWAQSSPQLQTNNIAEGRYEPPAAVNQHC